MKEDIGILASRQYYLSALKLCIIWALSILVLCSLISIMRNICLSMQVSPIVKKLEKYSKGPMQTTAVNKDGTIVPAVNYYEKEKAKEIMRRRGKRSRRRQKQRERRRRKRERRMMNRVIQEEDFADSMKLLEMQIGQLEDENDEKIIQNNVSKIEIEELPEILLSPVGSRRPSQLLDYSITHCSSPLHPSYLPSRPVSVLWSSTHTTERLYRYTHIERMVYPPGYVQHL